MFKVPGTKSIYEDEHVVSKFAGWLPPNRKHPKGGLQFYAVKGGLRSVDVRNIVEIH